MVPGPRARGVSLSSEEASRGIGGGLEWSVHGGWGSGGRWHAVRRARSCELALGGAESERGCTVKALVGFIGAGVGSGSSVARRSARGAEHRGVLWHCQGTSNMWSFLSA